MRTLRISFTVSEEAAGSVLADLADRVQNLDFGVIEQVPHTKNKTHKNGEARPVKNDSLAGTVITTLSTGNKSIQEMKDALMAGGFAAASLNGVLHKMQKDKTVKRIGHNLYSLRK